MDYLSSGFSTVYIINRGAEVSKSEQLSNQTEYISYISPSRASVYLTRYCTFEYAKPATTKANSLILQSVFIRKAHFHRYAKAICVFDVRIVTKVPFLCLNHIRMVRFCLLRFLSNLRLSYLGSIWAA